MTRHRFRIEGVRIEGVRIEAAQWRALELLEPGFIFMVHSAIHPRCRQGLIRRGWAEFRVYAGWMIGRLTAAGIKVRDRVHVQRAYDKARAQGERDLRW